MELHGPEEPAELQEIILPLMERPPLGEGVRCLDDELPRERSILDTDDLDRNHKTNFCLLNRGTQPG